MPTSRFPFPAMHAQFTYSPFPPRLAMVLRRLPICASLALALVSCGGGGSGSSRQGPAAGDPPVAALARGISVLAGVAGGAGNADGPVGRLHEPGALAIGRDGQLYVATFGAAVRRLAPDVDGTLVASTFWQGQEAPNALVADGAGNLVGILGKRIVRIAPGGVLTTLAGSGEEGMVDGPGAQARFSLPVALAIDPAGLVYVADAYRIRTVDSAGEVRTHAAATRALFKDMGELYGQPFGVNQLPTGLAFDHAGNLVIAVAGGSVRKLTPAGARIDAPLQAATAVATDREGRLYGFDDCTLYRTDATGAPVVLAGSSSRRGAVDGAGSEASFGTADRCTGKIAVDAAGNVFLSDEANHTVRKITPAGVVSTVAGKARVTGLQDGTGPVARFSADARDLHFDGKDSLYLVQDGKVRKTTRAGVVTTLNLPEKDAGQHPIRYFTGGVAYQGSLVGVANGVVYLVDDSGGMRALAGSPTAQRQADGSGTQAGFGTIRDVARDGAGNLYLLDSYEYREVSTDVFPLSFENRIRKLTPAGVVTTLYRTAPDDGTRQPWRLAADRQASVFAATNDHAVLRIAPDGQATRLAVDLKYVDWLAVDEGGRLFLASGYSLPLVIEQRDPDGQLLLVAGRRDQYGLVAGALPGSLNLMGGLAVDDKGLLYVLTENAVVRIVQ